MLGKILFTINIILLLFIWGYEGYVYTKLPDTIPVHFGLNGVPDGFGNKNLSWGLCIVSTILFLILNYLSKNNSSPLLNIPNSLKRNARLTEIFCQGILFFCMLLFLILTYDSAQVAMGVKTVLGPMTTVITVLMFIFIILFLVFANRLNNSKKTN